MNEALKQNASIELSVAHLVLLQDLVSEKLSCIPLNEHFTEIEKKSIWIFEDILDQKLVDLDMGSWTEEEWNDRASTAAEHLKTQPCDFLPE